MTHGLGEHVVERIAEAIVIDRWRLLVRPIRFIGTAPILAQVRPAIGQRRDL